LHVLHVSLGMLCLALHIGHLGAYLGLHLGLSYILKKF